MRPGWGGTWVPRLGALRRSTGGRRGAAPSPEGVSLRKPFRGVAEGKITKNKAHGTDVRPNPNADFGAAFQATPPPDFGRLPDDPWPRADALKVPKLVSCVRKPAGGGAAPPRTSDAHPPRSCPNKFRGGINPPRRSQANLQRGVNAREAAVTEACRKVGWAVTGFHSHSRC